jgi:formylglycine-generating enzyme required for sulfatase activity
LPSVLEWANIRILTTNKEWTPPQRKMMKRAGRVHGLRALGLSALVALLTWGGIESYGTLRGSSLVESLKTADTADVPSLVRQLGGVRRWANPRLEALAKTADDGSREKLHASLALLLVDPSQVDFLFRRLLQAKSDQLPVLRDALKPHQAALVPRLWSALESAKPGDPNLLAVASALADYDATSPRWEPVAATVAQTLVGTNPFVLGPWLPALKPVWGTLNAPLESVFQDPAMSESERSQAASILADFAAGEPARLARLLTVATPQQYGAIYPVLESRPTPTVIDDLARVAAAPPPPQLGSVERVPFGQRRANAAVTLLRLGERDKVLPVFEWTDDPEALTQFVFRCRDRGVEVEALLDCLERVGKAPPDRYPRYARYALLLALGEFALADVPESRRESLLNQLAAWYRHDPSSGVHGATGWLLRHWGQVDVARQVDETAVPYSPDREWFTLAITVTPTANAGAEMANAGAVFEPAKPATSPALPPSRTFYYTFVVFPAGESTIGSVIDELGRLKDESRHSVTLTRPFVLLDREITMAELMAYHPRYAAFMRQYDATPEVVGFGVSWYDAVGFCRWLGKQSGLPETDQAYADPATVDKEEYPREPDPAASWAPREWPLDLGRRGFRLPTEAEWELACRAGARTTYGFGSDESLLGRFGWYAENSGKHGHPPRELRPSLRGVFDLHGNVFEWTHDWYGEYVIEAATDPSGPKGGSTRVLRGGGWGGDAAVCRTANRGSNAPSDRSSDGGLRLVLSPSGVLPEAGKDR